MPRLIAVAAIALVPLGCGDDDDGGSDTTASVARYCELTQELDKAGEKAFKDLENDSDATRKDFVAAERQFVEENQESLEAVQDVAPAEITDDVAILVKALRARAGLEAGIPSEADAAEGRINKFEKENCA